MAITQDGGSGNAPGSLSIDEETDLALLDQHLIKTNALSKRMKTILSQLDSRLSRLDRSVAPLGIRQLSSTAHNIDAVLEVLAPGSATTARPQPSRQGSHQSSSAALASVNSSILDIPAPPPVSVQTRADKRRKHASIMDRGRAVPRPDNAPRWQEEDESSVISPIERTPPTQWDSGISSGTERGILQRNPDLSSLNEYMEALHVVIRELEDMNRGLLEGRGGDREAGVATLSNIVEESYGKLVQLLLKKTKDGLPRFFNPTSLAGSTVPQPLTWFPEFPRIRHLSAPLSMLVYPEEPTPKTTGLLAPILDDCIADLAGIRGEWFRQSIAPAASRIDEEATSWDVNQGGGKVRAVVSLWEGFLVAGEAEVALQSQLMPGASGEILVGKVLSYATPVLQGVMTNVIASVKRDLTGQTMLLLDLYANLTEFQAKLDSHLGQVLNTREAEEVREVLPSSMAILKQLAQRSFPERLVDIRNPSRNNVSSVGVDPTTHSTLSYIEILPRFGAVVEGLLRSGRGERSWLMGLPPPSTAKTAEEEGGVLNLYVADILGALIQHLDQKAKPMRKLASYTYQLNNLSHIRNTTSSFHADVVGVSAENMLNKAFRDAKARYLGEWQDLTKLLQHTAHARFGVGGPSEKQSTKEAAASFFERLAELEAACKHYPLNRADPDMRDRVAAEADEIVRNGYKPFWTKGHSKGFDKYLKGTPDDVSRRVQAVFR